MKIRQLLGSFIWLGKAKYRASSVSGDAQNEIINRFHELYYDLGSKQQTWTNTKWFGTLVAKNPFDLWVYQEILHEVKPDLIIEAGTATGGSALYMASICDLLQNGRIITVDVAVQSRPSHPRIQYVTNSSTAPDFVKLVEEESKKAKTVMVVLDSDHSKSHVLDEMRLLNRFVTPGSYLIVEDSSVNGHPVFPEHGDGPYEAIDEFLKENKDFQIDLSREKFLMTFNPNGYLRRVSQ